MLHTSCLLFRRSLADTPWREGGWTRKQIVGHLLDSAANNRQRFVRAAIHGSFTGPDYAQDAWVAAHGYAGQPWETLLRWWEVEHEILAAVVDRIPEERLRGKLRHRRERAGHAALSHRGLLQASALASGATHRSGCEHRRRFA
jgi:hypothetical protein